MTTKISPSVNGEQAPQQEGPEDGLTRPGSSTSEFKLALIGCAAGVFLLYSGDKELGVELIKWSIVGYAGARGLTKLNTKKA